MQSGARHDVVAGDRCSAFFLPDAASMILQAAQKRRAQAGFHGCPHRESELYCSKN